MSTTPNPRPRTPEELLDWHRKAVYGYLVNRTCCRADAEDLYQEVCVRVVRAWKRFHSGDGRAWVFRIARNLLFNFQTRQATRRGVALDSVPEPQATSEEDDRQAQEDERQAKLTRLAGCLGRLSAEQRRVVTERAAGRSCDDLAEEMQVPVKTVYSNGENGLARLKRCLGVSAGGTGS